MHAPIAHYSLSPSSASSPFGFAIGDQQIVPKFLQETAVIWLSGQKRIFKIGQFLMTLLFPTVITHQSQNLELFYKLLNSQNSFFNHRLLIVWATKYGNL